jgi:hypothetical protein
VVEENIFENEDQGRNKKRYNHQQLRDPKSRIKKGMKIKLDCEYCKGPIAGHPLFSGLQIMNGFSVVLDVCLVISKNMLGE